MYHSDAIQKRYKGFCATKVLWHHSFKGLNQLHVMHSSNTSFSRALLQKRRLGQLAEQFAFHQLEQLENCRILAENVQIQKGKQTIGELDALIELNRKPIHLEGVYKFYVYDKTKGTSEIEHWIGPNRKDSLIEKITKLKNKQLPLLHSSECMATLKELNLNRNSIQQEVLFKAQLFIPYQKTVNFNELNQDCVCGFYINKSQLNDFNTCKFYIPEKLDWFLKVNDCVDWLNFETFKSQADVFLQASQSPLIWIKKHDESFIKCFLVWW
ncbi:DUF1853 family protein [Psychroserpens mesophilus]|uniref:DUF1853 family protein n=1 Tax=Psychroserpens mesophilus TaxID=325473 RepID=UPI003D64C1E8